MTKVADQRDAPEVPRPVEGVHRSGVEVPQPARADLAIFHADRRHCNLS